MYAPDYLACREESLHGLERRVYNTAVDVGFHATHAVMNSRPYARDAIGRLLDGKSSIGDRFVEILVKLVDDKGVVPGDLILQGFERYIELIGDLFN